MSAPGLLPTIGSTWQLRLTARRPYVPSDTSQRNAVLVGGTGTGKTHLAIAFGRARVRSGARVRFYNKVDLVNRLEAEARAGKPGRIADHLSRLDLVILDELGYLPSQQGRSNHTHDGLRYSCERPRSTC